MRVANHGDGLDNPGVGVHHPPATVEHDIVGGNHSIIVARGFAERAFVIVEISHFAEDAERQLERTVVVTLSFNCDKVVAGLDASLAVTERIVSVEHERVVAVGQHGLRMDGRTVRAVLACVMGLDFGVGDAAWKDVEEGGETAITESHSNHGNRSLADIGIVGPLNVVVDTRSEQSVAHFHTNLRFLRALVVDHVGNWKDCGLFGQADLVVGMAAVNSNIGGEAAQHMVARHFIRLGDFAVAHLVVVEEFTLGQSVVEIDRRA